MKLYLERVYSEISSFQIFSGKTVHLYELVVRGDGSSFILSFIWYPHKGLQLLGE